MLFAFSVDRTGRREPTNLEACMADDVTGKVTHLGGKLKEGLGDLLGDRQMKTEGRLEQVEGAAEQDAARAEAELQQANARRLAAEDAQRLNRG
jgi:uncharacterized protein YjbJ (UPF0337 family)